jgi:hypothetical protein
MNQPNPNMNTQAEVRAAFWEDCFPEVKKSYTRKKQNEYPADIRCAFVDYVDSLQKSGQISEALAFRATL